MPNQCQCVPMTLYSVDPPEGWTTVLTLSDGERIRHQYRYHPFPHIVAHVNLYTESDSGIAPYHLNAAMSTHLPERAPRVEYRVEAYDDPEEALRGTEAFLHAFDETLRTTEIDEGTYADDVLPPLIDEFAPGGPPREPPFSERLKRRFT